MLHEHIVSHKYITCAWRLICTQYTSKKKKVALTAHANKTDIDDCLGAGMDRYMSKPLNLADMKVCACIHMYIISQIHKIFLYNISYIRKYVTLHLIYTKYHIHQNTICTYFHKILSYCVSEMLCIYEFYVHLRIKYTYALTSQFSTCPIMLAKLRGRGMMSHICTIPTWWDVYCVYMRYGVATISRLLKMTGIICKRAL